MKEKIKNFLYGIGGVGFILLIVGTLSLLIVGGAKLFEFLSPILEKISFFVWGVVWLFIILSLVPRLRKFTGNGILLGTYIGGAIYWLLCFHITYSLWGVAGILLGVLFLGLGVYFTAILALLLKAQFILAAVIAFGVAQIFFLRWFGYWIITKYKPPKKAPILEEDFSSEKYVAVPAKKLRKKPLSFGIVLLAIFLFILGTLELFTFFKSSSLNFHIVWGCLAIASGIGLLLQKFWAYRLTQVLVIINIVAAPFSFFLPDFKTQVAMIIVGIWIIINGVILWYLSRKNIKEQFLEAILTEKLEKQKSIP
jgi:uncharacterized membrane protein HdeD (DUF308 family)